jgi:20S proteasome alpha/beta subunit
MVLLWMAVLVLSVPTALSQSAAGQETLVGIVGKDFVILGADSSISSSIAFTACNLDKIAILNGPRTIAAAAAGDAADSDRLLGLLSAHCAIREYEHGGDVTYIWMDELTRRSPRRQQGLTVQEIAHLARNQIASSLRSRNQLKVCLLVAGMMMTSSDEIESEDFSRRLQQQASGNAKSESTTTTATNIMTTNTISISGSLKPNLFWLDPYGSLQKIQYGAHGHGANFVLSLMDQSYRPDLGREEAIQIVRNCFDQLRIRYVINAPQPPCIKCIDNNGCQLIQ